MIRLAGSGIVGPNGVLEWETEAGPIHDASLLPNGNILFQRNWTEIVEMTPDKRIVWQYDAGKSNGNSGRHIEVHAFQRLDDGLTMIAESGSSRIIEVDRDGNLKRQVHLRVRHPDSHMEVRLARKLASGNYLVAQQGDGTVVE